MLDTFIKIGEKLREDKSTVQFLPFVEFGEKEAKYSIKKGEKKLIQEKPFVQVYDVFIEENNWKFEKSENPYNENTNITIIKGDNNDRFYIAGDINGDYFGKKIKLEKYFKNIEKYIRNNDFSKFVYQFRKHLKPNLKNITDQIKNQKENNPKKKIYIQFKFLEKDKIYYWQDLYNYIQEIGEFIIKEKYITKKKEMTLAHKIPVSFFTNCNLNTLQNLTENNSYKTIDIRKSTDKIKSLIVADKYLANKQTRLGKTDIQILPTGEYSREALLSFLKMPNLKKNNKALEIQNNSHTDSRDPIDLIFKDFTHTKSIYKYDVLFLNKGGQTTDIINYISSISKSDIDTIKERFRKARKRTLQFYNSNIKPKICNEKIDEIIIQKIKKEIYLFSSLNKIFAKISKEDKKLIKHHQTVLYKIFRNQYYQDTLLLPELINKIELSLRNNSEKNELNFLELFINFIYLNYILYKNQFSIMKNTQSYKAGILLGKLAKNLDQEINSFSKQYAGNISRRISTKKDFQKLLNFIHEKLVMHEKTNFVRKESTELNELLSSFTERYKKDYAVAGFFYSYMMPFKKD